MNKVEKEMFETLTAKEKVLYTTVCGTKGFTETKEWQTLVINTMLTKENLTEKELFNKYGVDTVMIMIDNTNNELRAERVLVTKKAQKITRALNVKYNTAKNFVTFC